MSNLSTPIPVRFEADQKSRMEVLARRFGLKSSDLVRMAVAQMLETAERTGQLIFDAREDRLAEDDTPADSPPAQGAPKKKVNYRDDHKPTRPAPRDKRSDTVKKP